MACDRIIYNILLDIFVLTLLAIPLLLIVVLAEPFEVGFFLDDQSIRLPYKEESIPSLVLSLCGFALIIVMILFTEVVRNKKRSGVEEKSLFGLVIPGCVWESYRGIGVFCFGAICQQLIVNIGKYVIGRLRPHFFQICNPVFNASSPLNRFGYISNYTCASADFAKIKKARLSFPSGHSSFAMYTAVFCIFYLQTKTKWRGAKLIRHAAQFVVFMAAWYVGLSRVKEHMHHWNDVAAGFLIGSAVATFTFVYILKPKKYELPHSCQHSAPQNGFPRPISSR